METRITQITLDLLRDVADYRVLSLSQIAHLHFGGKKAARRRMEQLRKEGLVELLPAMPAERGGRPENILGLSKAGLQLLKSKSILDERIEFEQVGGGNLVRQIAHQLLLGWSRIFLVHVCRTVPQLEVKLRSCNSPLALNPETGVPIARAEVVMKEGESPVRFTPDAVFVITDTAQPKSVLFFLEVDMGTEPLSSDDGVNIREKILRYKQYFRTKGYKRYETVWGVPLNGFRLLFVTHSSSNLGRLSAAVKAMEPTGFVWTTSADRMFEKGISDCIWSAGGCSERPAESILGSLALPVPLLGLKE